MDAILAYGEEAVPHVIEFLGDNGADGKGADAEDHDKILDFLIGLGDKAKPAVEALRAAAEGKLSGYDNFQRIHAARAIAEIGKEGGPLCTLVTTHTCYNDTFLQRIATGAFSNMTESAAKACGAALPELKTKAKGDDGDAGSAAVAIFSITGDGSRAIELMKTPGDARAEAAKGLRKLAEKRPAQSEEIKKMLGKVKCTHFLHDPLHVSQQNLHAQGQLAIGAISRSAEKFPRRRVAQTCITCPTS